MSDDIPLFQMAWGRADVQNVLDSVTRGSYWANGPYVTEFEEALKAYHDVDYAVVFNSGTTALQCALQAAGVGPGDEVIVPSFTFIATANAARLVGAKPVFADIERDRYGLDPDSVRDAITSDTAAIVPVHYGGKPCRIHEITDLAAEHDVEVIEDTAEAFGATTEGEVAGTIGDAGVMSFCQNKVITTGEGGAVVTDDDELARELELFRSHGRTSSEYFDSVDGSEYIALGSNFRMADVVASIGVAQMEKAEDLIEQRREVAAEYAARLADVPGVEAPTDPPSGRHVYQLFTVSFDADIDRDAIASHLSAVDIGSKVYFEPVHEEQYYREEPAPATDLSVTEELSERVLSLPMYPGLTAEEVDRVVTAIETAIHDT